MPAGVSMSQYLKALAAFVATPMAGSVMVFHYYKPKVFEGFEEQVEEEKVKIRKEFEKYCERKLAEQKHKEKVS